ncbi:UNVERIFIED_CONTAM: hypothetical protein Slati_0962500 [Sesamum latifolium]|uniref:Uncharacterized protein n=1 Tax=Sesamum latifolium TaxID=2727402 RepID=A0AAW2XRI4_9LAMI
MQTRQYPFLDSDVSGIFDDLLEANLIDLPEMKRSEEVEQRDDPKYYKYHRLVGHAIQDCFVFKDKVMQLAQQDYFSKWAEAVPLKEVKKENVADFIRTDIIYHYGVPSLLNEVAVKSKRDWHERTGEALWAYRTTQITSLRIAIQEGLTEEENARIRLKELEALDEKRLEAQQKVEYDQARLSKVFNKKYIVKEAYTNGAYKLVANEGLRIGPINRKFLKRYNA